MTDIFCEKVNSLNRDTIPGENDTIYDDFNINCSAILEINIYLRPQHVCPLGRGNWIIDLRFLSGQLACIKLPKEMSEESVMKFVKPLIKDIDKLKRQHH